MALQPLTREKIDEMKKMTEIIKKRNAKDLEARQQILQQQIDDRLNGVTKAPSSPHNSLSTLDFLGLFL